MNSDGYIEDLREENELLRESLRVAMTALDSIAYDNLVDAGMYRCARKALIEIANLRGE